MSVQPRWYLTHRCLCSHFSSAQMISITVPLFSFQFSPDDLSQCPLFSFQFSPDDIYHSAFVLIPVQPRWYLSQCLCSHFSSAQMISNTVPLFSFQFSPDDIYHSAFVLIPVQPRWYLSQCLCSHFSSAQMISNTVPLFSFQFSPDDIYLSLPLVSYQFNPDGIHSWIILWMRPANERRRYNVTSSPIGWAHTQNDPCPSITMPLFSLQYSIDAIHLSQYSRSYFHPG